MRARSQLQLALLAFAGQVRCRQSCPLDEVQSNGSPETTKRRPSTSKLVHQRLPTG